MAALFTRIRSFVIVTLAACAGVPPAAPAPQQVPVKPTVPPRVDPSGFARVAGSLCPPVSETAGTGDGAAALGLAVAPGLRVTRWADETIAGDLQTLTFDPQGAVVVSGPGSIERLGCPAGPPAPETLMTTPTGVMGLAIEADGASLADDGALAFVPARQGVLDPSARTVMLAIKSGEHGPHQVSRGPDGWWYALTGNEQRWSPPSLDPARSPIVRVRGGKLLRWPADRSHVEIVSDGLRNPYRFDVTADGDVLTFDSDGERDVSLPWYLPTRVMQLLEGGDHGWLLPGWVRSYALRPEAPDRVDVLALMGRSSPTGVVVYRHTLLPARYREGVFIADWTFGRVLFVPLRRTGTAEIPGASLQAGEPEEILKSTGTEGFAPSDLQVGPDGALYVAIGGRRTRGSVFRIAPLVAPPAAPLAGDDLLRVLQAPQPLSSWSRARWEPPARALGRDTFATAARDASRALELRLRAIEIAVDLFGGLPGPTAAALATDRNPRVRARTAWALGRAAARSAAIDEPALDLLATLARDEAPLVRQRALTALGDQTVWAPPTLTAVLRALPDNVGHPERRVRLAAAALAARLPAEPWQRLEQSITSPDLSVRTGLLVARALRDRRQGQPATGIADAALALWPRAHKPPEWHPLVRLIQIGLGDFALDKPPAEVFTLYAPGAAVDAGLRQRALFPLRTLFPSGDAVLDEELLRTLAMLQDDAPETHRRVLASLTRKSSATWDAHAFIALARLGVPPADGNPALADRPVAARLASTLLGLRGKLGVAAEPNLASWDERLGEALRVHLEHHPALGEALARHPLLPRPSHLSIALALPPPARALAAQRFFEVATAKKRGAPPFPWSEALVDLIAGLPRATIAPALRAHGGELALRDKVVTLLAEHPETQDRPLFVGALASPSAPVRSAALSALDHLPLPDQAQPELLALRTWLRALCDRPNEAALRARVRARLVALAGAGPSPPALVDHPGAAREVTRAAHAPFFAWLSARVPALASAEEEGPVTPEAFLARLGSVPWNKGDPSRGERLLRERACAGCHGGATPMGPALAGVGTRMSREDLLTAIVDPSRDVSPLYAATVFDTRSGESLTGFITYEAEVVMLRTGATTMVRIPASDIVAKRPADASLMPVGLLEGLTAQDVADLFAHLQTLR